MSRDNAVAEGRETEKKLKAMESDTIHLHEDTATAERLRRQALPEREEQQDEINSSNTKSSLPADKRRKLEAHISEL